jgi:PKHD-type hydroxylase
MKGEWCYWSGALSKEQCELVIQTIKTRPAQDATLGASGERSDSQYRRSKIRFIRPDDIQLGFLFDLLWKQSLKANDDWFGFHLSKIDYLQVAEYNGDQKGEYKPHHDVFYINGTEYHRKLSAIIQLSDPATYIGGSFEMYDTSSNPPADKIKEQGCAIFFPSFVRHAALPVTQGTRYSIAAWIDGPHWR